MQKLEALVREAHESASPLPAAGGRSRVIPIARMSLQVLRRLLRRLSGNDAPAGIR
jgi:hypothetical protein